MARTFEITTPLGADVLLLHRAHAREELAAVGECEVELLSKRGDIAIDEILAKTVNIRMETAADQVRHLDGYVTRFAQVGMHGRFHRYRATVRPWLWFLSRTADCRIFQEMNVVDIVTQVFGDHNFAAFEFKTTASYPKREYCVQYRETDLNFVMRLLEEEGLYFHFEHDESKHTMIIADSYSAHPPCPGYETIPFAQATRSTGLEKEYVHEWTLAREVQPGNYVLEDFDFKKPSSELLSKSAFERSHVLADGEVFDYPGLYLTGADGTQLARTRIEELQHQFEQCRGRANARGIRTGHLFKLTEQPREDQNREYLVISTDIDLEYSDYESLDSRGSSFDCRFRVLESQQPFRPRRVTPRPMVQGPQTAIVVGPAGEEIYTDEFGRVKVQFHWDRYGQKNESSSCWIRVSHPWAGKNWGMVAIPRIGQEVIVEFLEGDPDRPIITGRVYNAEQMPPYELPANKTQTGIKSRSSMSGSPANFNEIRFEDKKGSEQVYIHAEKNQDIVVENDETHTVGHDRTKDIGHDETTTVGHDRTETVGNNETITIGVNRTETVGSNESITIGSNRTETVGANETITIGANRTEMVGANEAVTIGANQAITIAAAAALTVGAARAHTVGAAEAITIGAAQAVIIGAEQSVTIAQDQSTTIGADHTMSVAKNESRMIGEGRTTDVGKDDSLKVGKNLVIDAGDSITIKTGSASITMKKDGTISIKGKDITIEGSGKINVKASNDIVMKGSKILQN